MIPKRVLVVDDEAPIREALKRAFKEAGYEVVLAASAEEALKLPDLETIQVQFVDLQLPGMSGLDLCRRIRETNSIALIFAMTGYASIFHLVECREAGFDDYFVKPFQVDQLLRVAKDAFEKVERWRRGR